MSVFSLIKRGRQAAKEHKAELAEKQKAEVSKPAYRHVPTHAAVDAMAGAPSTWREDDRVRIVEQNRRRSAMASSGMGSMVGIGMNPVHMGMPRVNSALSHVSYPSLYANPHVSSVPRAYSYSGSILPSWEEHGSEVVYSSHQSEPPNGVAGKGKAVEKVLMVDSGRPSSHGSSKAPSPVGSSSNSTTSEDNLEMKTVRHSKGGSTLPTESPATSPEAKPSPRLGPEPEHVHRLHPAHARRPSDPTTPAERYYPPRVNYRQPQSASSSRPGSASRGIPPVPALPQIALGPSTTSSAGSTTSSSRAPSILNSTGVSPGATHTTNSSVSSSPSTPKAAALPESPVSPVTAPSGSPRSAISAIAIPEPKFEFEFASTPAATTELRELPPLRVPLPAPSAQALPQPPKAQATVDRRAPKPTKVAALETIDSNVELRPVVSRDASSTTRAMVTLPTTGLPTDFDEAAFSPFQPFQESSASPTAQSQQKRGKLTKMTKTPQSPAKPAKKNRWSLRSKSTPVAG